ncbi:MAG: hypothetical protein QOF35_1957 [Actinomycetota bacterium]|jgi:aryl-alcohol dehydrogenase-like predicted oxidoreductase|nr:hypothetical protein [Actinomycetota bacterium]
MTSTSRRNTPAPAGLRRPAQVDLILAAANIELDDDDIATIEGRD